MKYYYKGQLIRTSKNVYSHAVVAEGENGKIWNYGCSSRLDLAQKNLNGIISNEQKAVNQTKNALNKMKAGVKDTWYAREYTIEQVEGFLKSHEARLDWYQKNLKVVELEVKGFKLN